MNRQVSNQDQIEEDKERQYQIRLHVNRLDALAWNTLDWIGLDLLDGQIDKQEASNCQKQLETGRRWMSMWNPYGYMKRYHGWICKIISASMQVGRIGEGRHVDNL